MKNFNFFFIFFFIFLINKSSFSKEIYIAVSSNFLITIQKISLEFEKKYKCKVIISSDSTANLFNKIKLGVPFDVFISADSFYPKLLEDGNNKSLIYSFGKIVFFKKNFLIKKNFLFLFEKFNYISLANPKLSPYGYAGNITFNNLKIKNVSFIFTSNINQSFNFIYSGINDCGIVSLSHIIHGEVEKYYTWKIPKYLYKEIEQRLIILKNSKNKDLSMSFVNYINSKESKILIKNQGYKISNE